DLGSTHVRWRQAKSVMACCEVGWIAPRIGALLSASGESYRGTVVNSNTAIRTPTPGSHFLESSGLQRRSRVCLGIESCSERGVAMHVLSRRMAAGVAIITLCLCVPRTVAAQEYEKWYKLSEQRFLELKQKAGASTKPTWNQLPDWTGIWT